MNILHRWDMCMNKQQLNTLCTSYNVYNWIEMPFQNCLPNKPHLGNHFYQTMYMIKIQIVKVCLVQPKIVPVKLHKYLLNIVFKKSGRQCIDIYPPSSTHSDGQNGNAGIWTSGSYIRTCMTYISSKCNNYSITS